VLNGWVVAAAAFAYLGLLFAIAYYADKRAAAGRSVIANPYIYSLSLAVYATAWTFYGSVGRAAVDGVGFLPIYVGPTLMLLLWWFVVRKMIRIAKLNRITSLADFIAARYGKSALLGGLVTVIAVVGILPYISLQLKAISGSFQLLLQYPEVLVPRRAGPVPMLEDTAFYVALMLALFTIAFGTRHLDAAERHEGMVAAIALESIVKLVAFVAVGI
jgi:Na+/proline symporter